MNGNIDLLDLQGLEIDPTRNRKTDDGVTVIGIRRRPGGFDHCPYCGSVLVVPNGTRTVSYQDIPALGNPVVLEWQRQRFLCFEPECGKSFPDAHPLFHPKRQMTTRMVEWVAKRATRHTFEAVAQDAHIDERTVRNVFNDWAETELERRGQVKTPRVLGLDEVHLLKQMRGVITNVQERTLVDMVRSRTKDAMFHRLALLPDRENIEVVTMDMWKPYRDVVEELFPWADIIVDKWHVQKGANEALEKVRRALRSDLTKSRRVRLKDDRWILLTRRNKLKGLQPMILESWGNEFPELLKAYNLKETFFDIYTAKSEAEARELYMAWQADLRASGMTTVFQPIVTFVGNWHQQIFNYFNHPHRLTNAYTEALNGLVKIANRNGRGYSFDVLRARMLLMYDGAMKDRGAPPGASYRLLPGDPMPEFTGVHLPTLVGFMSEEDPWLVSTE